jgi:hypothetical protein
MKLRLLLIILCLVQWFPSYILFAKGAAEEGIFNKLLAPGPLMEGHKDLEHGDCLKCHEATKGIPDKNCLSCHKEIRESVNSKDSFHAQHKKPCIDCHADHKGRKYDTVQVNKNNFNHALTGFSLRGAHDRINCEKCHTEKRHGKFVRPSDTRYFGLQDSCNICHRKDDPHKFLPPFNKKECSVCHNENSWKNAVFNHGKETGYEIRGAHKKLECSDCHTPGPNKTVKYKFPELKSEGCHTCHQDYHGFREEKSNILGNLVKCQSCHGEDSWKNPIQFNHGTQTAYPLTGEHKKVKCFECHITKTGSKTSNATNVPRVYDFPTLESKTCETCHKSPHPNDPNSVFRQKPCSSCHTTDGWKKISVDGKSFNHNMTRFPLTGDHVNLSCNQCHQKNGKEVYKFPNADKQFCITCHPTPHKGQFEPKYVERSCAECHNTTDFQNILKFDHDKTKFKLTGHHKSIEGQCKKCHIPTKQMLNTKPPRPAGKFIFSGEAKGYCTECHTNVHKGQFSSRVNTSDCRTCHTTVDFTNRLSFDHRKTRFPLTGAHSKVKSCDECHIKTNKFLPTKPPKPAGKYLFADFENGFCSSCHKSVHTKQFSQEFLKKPCKECHTTHSFQKLLPFDHDLTDFKIDGAHDKIRSQCIKCHVKTSAMLPTDPPKQAGLFKFAHHATGYCEACHKSEHVGQFSEKFSSMPCMKCHTTVTFQKRLPFDHNKTDFELHGKHVGVACNECHKPTDKKFSVQPFHKKGQFIFENLASKDCALCHKDVHNGKFGKKCSSCHNEEGWKIGSSFHNDLVLSGVHLLLQCTDCHKEQREMSGTGHDCKKCHIKDDIHHGTLSDCTNCHNQQFWSVTKFAHSLTEFPLRGIHRLLHCNDCHAGGVYQGKSGECVSCHQDNASKVTFPNHNLPGFEVCSDCHNQFMFKGASKGS